MQRPPLGELATMDNSNNNNTNTMNQLLQSCAALHAVSSNNSFGTLQTNSSNSNTLLPLQPRKLQPNENNNNNDDEVNDENAGPLRQATNNTTNTNKVELRADLNQLAALRRTRAPTMSRRNERERNRVRYLNFTFDVLRQHLPRERAKGKAKKMSKVDTLRGAIDYIRDLQDVLGVDGLPTGALSSLVTPGDASAGSFAGTESESDSLSPRGSPGFSGGSPEDGEVGSDQEDELEHHLAGWFC